MKKYLPKPIICLLLCLFVFQATGFAQLLPVSFQSPLLEPATLRYLSVNAANPSNYFNFLLDKGNNGLNQTILSSEARRLINYFFLGITLPSDCFWVNLQPGQQDEMISEELARTKMGKVLLEQDLELKKAVALCLHPEHPLGKQFWERLYQRIGGLTQEITTSNRVWIVPEEVVVVETYDGAYVANARLKVLHENEYLKVYPTDSTQIIVDELMKELILPALSEQVNTSAGFAPLRQIFYSMILAEWFKRKHSEENSTYAQLINSRNTDGLESKVPWSQQPIWQEYITSHREGEYKVTKTLAGSSRLYTSGGIDVGMGDTTALGSVRGVRQTPVQFTVISHTDPEANAWLTTSDETAFPVLTSPGKSSLEPEVRMVMRAQSARAASPVRSREAESELVQEYNSLMDKEIRINAIDGTIEDRYASTIRNAEIISVSLIDDAPENGHVYLIISIDGRDYLIITDRANKITGVAVDVAMAGDLGFMDFGNPLFDYDAKYVELPSGFYKDFEAKLKAAFVKIEKGDQQLNDQRDEYGSARKTDKLKAKLFFPLINSIYGIAELRNDFVQNVIIRNLLRRLGSKIFAAHSREIYMSSAKKDSGAFSTEESTLYDLHNFRSRKQFPLFFWGMVAHEFAHVWYAQLGEREKQALQGYFLNNRESLEDTIRTNPLYSDISRTSVTDEMIAHIVQHIAIGQLEVTIQDAAFNMQREPITYDDVNILVNYGFLPEEFRVSPAEVALGNTIDPDYVQRVYPPARGVIRAASPLEQTRLQAAAVPSVGQKTEFRGGIDLSEIEMRLEDEIYVSSMVPCDRKVLFAAQALKEEWQSLSLLYVHEIIVMWEERLLEEFSNHALLTEVMRELDDEDYLDSRAQHFLQYLKRGDVGFARPAALLPAN